MNPAEKLTTILEVLAKEGYYSYFTSLQVMYFGTTPPEKVIDYRNDKWKLDNIALEPLIKGESYDYRLKCRFLMDQRIREIAYTFEFYIQHAISQLRVYKYFTETSYYGFNIDIELTKETYLTLIFYPIVSDALDDIEDEIGEELPWQEEIGKEIETPFKTFVSEE
jgi:hypothetical protein